jgi:hypothetical protein
VARRRLPSSTQTSSDSRLGMAQVDIPPVPNHMCGGFRGSLQRFGEFL